ncbi:putative nuclease HARBI1 isoform 2-T2 [Anomaloglossus baeobatrachus]
MLSSAEQVVLSVGLIVTASLLEEEERKQVRRNQRRRRMWSRERLLRRPNLTHMQPVRELQERNPQDFRDHLRMSEASFTFLLNRVRPYIQRKNTVMRAAIPVEERLGVTLRFLATGRSLSDLRQSAALSRSLLSMLIPETCQAIIHSLRDFMPFPKSAVEWSQIADDFASHWQFPNCGGALDGKHIRITQPPNSGSYFYNYKGYFSIILMALVNANYEFITVDVGMNGRVSDGGLLEHTVFGQRLARSELPLPPNSVNCGNMNFVFVGDEAFPLQTHLLRPYPQSSLTPSRRVYNYRLSRARRVVENAFGIMSSRFRVFSKPINLKLASIDSVVLACCVLHNFLRKRDAETYMPPGYVDTDESGNGDVVPGAWREQDPKLASLNPHSPSDRSPHDALSNRERYCSYFNGPGL